MVVHIHIHRVHIHIHKVHIHIHKVHIDIIAFTNYLLLID